MMMALTKTKNWFMFCAKIWMYSGDTGSEYMLGGARVTCEVPSVDAFIAMALGHCWT